MPSHAVIRDGLSILGRLLARVGRPAWATPVLVALGLLASLAETVGITLVLALLYLLSGQQVEVGSFGARIAGFFGGGDGNGGTARLTAAVIALILLRALLAALYSRTAARVATYLSIRTTTALHQDYLDAEYTKITSFEVACLMEVLGTHSWIVASAYQLFTRIIINGCSLLVFAMFLVALSWQATLVAAVGFAVVSLSLRRMNDKARALGAESQALHKAMGEHMLMTVQAMRTIRAFGHERDHQQRFTRSAEAAGIASMRSSKQAAWIGPLSEIGNLAVLFVIVVGAPYWGLDFPTILAAVVLLYRAQPHFAELQGSLLGLAQAHAPLEAVATMFSELDGARTHDAGQDIASLAGPICFDGVSLRYAGARIDALDNANFEIPHGKTTALVGVSGAGKTTIVNLLLRLYAPGSGTISVDGTPLQSVRRSAWLALLGVAGQDVDLIEGTVADNIRLADPSADEHHLLTAARAAGVDDFVSRLSDGYDAWIGQEGLRFSGGQRQRIGLARALLRRPHLLILDEAMNALDLGLEQRITASIDQYLGGSTVLIITHRLETIRNVDHVIWIDAGRVRGEGPPAVVLPQLQMGLERFGRDTASS